MATADRPTIRATARQVGLPLAALVGAVVVWWAATALLSVPSYLVPTPASVASELAATPALYARHAVATLQKVLAGAVLGTVAGLLLAVVVTASPWLRRALVPYLVTARVLPKIAIAPVLLIYLGVGFSTAVLFVALVAFFPMVVSAIAGFDRVSERHLDLVRSVDAGPIRTFAHVRIPAALPDVFAGLRQSMTLAVVGAVVAEWIVADDGLGFLVLFAAENVRTAVLVAALLMLFVEGVALYGAVVALQRLVGFDGDRRPL